MTDDERLAFDLLHSLDFAALRRTGPGTYAFFGRAPAFYDALFPPTADGPCPAPWAISSMLEFFLAEAEDFFGRSGAGSISSGTWEEEGLTRENTALKAIAANLGAAQVIVVCLLQEEHSERTGILQSAREQLLENRLLVNNLSILREKSRTDGLTGVLNRTTFMELLFDEVTRSQILEYQLALLILDIDDFKKINDTHGHPTGDKILQGMGAMLKSSLRRNDVVARYGGEEFAVLLTHAPLEQATQIAEKIRANLAAMSVPDAPRITVSVGCTAYSPDESPEHFFKRADNALYLAKREGKNRVCIGNGGLA